MTRLYESPGAIMFTDVEGSTRHWESNASAMSAALADHDELVGGVIADHRGDVFSTQGDGLVAAFADCRSAVVAATAIQRAVTDHRWPEDCEIRVRVGVHTGPTELRNDGYFGRTMNRAARVSSAGHGRQIVISDAAAAQLEGSDLPDGITLRSEGEHRLKGVSDPIRIWSVLAPGLPDDFPPLRTLGDGPTTIPLTLTSLIGRDREVGEVLDLVADHRVVTVLGPGGTGKTRLAVEVATRAVGPHPGGVHVVELAALPPATPIASTVVDTILGVDPLARSGQEVARLVAAAGGPTLIVLDNCEHVAEEAAHFAETLLAASAEFRILATSRERLFVAGEQLVPLEPLTTSEDEGRSPAGQLFAERARAAAAPGPTLDRDAIERICHRLDGLPLAIELAAARLSSLSLADLEANLFEVLRSRRRGRRDGGRHSTIDAAIEWSHAHLDADEQRVLARCSVFAGSFDLDAATDVAGGGSGGDGGDDHDPVMVMELIGSLADRSFLSPVYTEDGNRYRLLEVIRVFAAARLDASGERAETEARHQTHFRRKVRAAFAATGDSANEALVAALELDDANVAAALALRGTADQLKSARILALTLHPYWEESGRFREAVEHVGRLLEPADPANPTWLGVAGLAVTYGNMAGVADLELEGRLGDLTGDEPDLNHVGIYWALSMGALGRARFEETCHFMDRVVAVCPPEAGALARNSLLTAGACSVYDDRAADAVEYHRRAVDFEGQTPDWFESYHGAFAASARILNGGDVDELAGLATHLEDLDRAGLGMRLTLGALQGCLGFHRFDRRDEMERWARVALTSARDSGFLWAAAVALEHLAWWHAAAGRPDEAARRWGAVEATWEQAGYVIPALIARLREPAWGLVAAELGPVDFESLRAEGAAVTLAGYAAVGPTG